SVQGFEDFTLPELIAQSSKHLPLRLIEPHPVSAEELSHSRQEADAEIGARAGIHGHQIEQVERPAHRVIGRYVTRQQLSGIGKAFILYAPRANAEHRLGKLVEGSQVVLASAASHRQLLERPQIRIRELRAWPFRVALVEGEDMRERKL